MAKRNAAVTPKRDRVSFDMWTELSVGGGKNEELAPQTSAFTHSLALMCPLEFSLAIPRSRVDEEKNTKIPRRVSMGDRP